MRGDLKQGAPVLLHSRNVPSSPHPSATGGTVVVTPSARSWSSSHRRVELRRLKANSAGASRVASSEIPRGGPIVGDPIPPQLTEPSPSPGAIDPDYRRRYTPVDRDSGARAIRAGSCQGRCKVAEGPFPRDNLSLSAPPATIGAFIEIAEPDDVQQGDRAPTRGVGPPFSSRRSPYSAARR